MFNMNLDPMAGKFGKHLSDKRENSDNGVNRSDHIFNNELEEMSSEKLRKPGDLNDDGKIDFEDVLILKEVLEGKRKLGQKELEYADLNGDGVVDYKDLNLMINLVIESRKAEDRVMELQGVYDQLQMKRDQGLAKSGMDKARIDTVKDNLEQAIADFILRSYDVNK
jgi:hypothetical protein